MDVAAIQAGALTASSGGSAGSTGRNTLGKDDFLKLLVTQLQYQNPLEPAGNDQLLNQLALFGMLEQLGNLTQGLSEVSALVKEQGEAAKVQWQEEALNRAAALIGREVHGMGVTGESWSGVVQSARLQAGSIYLVVGGQEFPFSEVEEVG